MRKTIKIVYLGAFPTTQLIDKSDGKIDSLYRTSQTLINALRKLPNVNLTVITSPDIKSFPHNKFFYKKMYDDIDDVSMVSSLNVPIIKQLWTICSMTKECIKHIRKNDEQTIAILTHEINAIFIHLLIFSKNIAVRIITNPKNRVKTLPILKLETKNSPTPFKKIIKPKTTDATFKNIFIQSPYLL